MAALRAASVLASVATAAAHGAMVSPAPRNAIDTELPRWSHGKNTPRTGVIEPLEVGCANGTDACAIGQSVFWFSQGCSPGCRACDGNGTRFANWGECSSSRVRLPHTLSRRAAQTTARRSARRRTSRSSWLSTAPPTATPSSTPPKTSGGFSRGAVRARLRSPVSPAPRLSLLGSGGLRQGSTMHLIRRRLVRPLRHGRREPSPGH